MKRLENKFGSVATFKSFHRRVKMLIFLRDTMTKLLLQYLLLLINPQSQLVVLKASAMLTDLRLSQQNAGLHHKNFQPKQKVTWSMEK